MDRRQAQAKPGHQPDGNILHQPDGILLYEGAVEVPDGGNYPERFRAEYLTAEEMASRRTGQRR